MKDSPLVRFVKHPLVWSGAGLVIRYNAPETGKEKSLQSLGYGLLIVGLLHGMWKQETT